MEPTDPSARLDLLREQDEISSVQFAIETVKLWATFSDQHNPSVEGPSNTVIVESLLNSNDQIHRAYYAGYSGNINFPIGMTAKVSKELTSVFGRPVHNYRIKAQEAKYVRIHAVDEVIMDELEIDSINDHPRAQTYSSFAARIMGTHSIYQYLDRRIDKKFKSAQARPDESRIMPGKEEDFWSAALLGVRNSPGVFDTQGSLSRLMTSITETAQDLYGENAGEYLDAWWATVNILRDGGGTYKSALEDPLKALLRGDLGSARYFLKERLYNNRQMLPYRSRAKFDLEPDERDFFTELFSEAPKNPNDSVSPAEKIPELSREELFQLAQEHIGALLAWSDSNGQRAAYVRGIGIDTRGIRVKLIEDAEGSYSVVPYVLIMDYFSSNDGVTFRRHRMGGMGKQMRIENFGALHQKNKLQRIDEGDKYLDRSTTTYQINE